MRNERYNFIFLLMILIVPYFFCCPSSTPATLIEIEQSNYSGYVNAYLRGIVAGLIENSLYYMHNIQNPSSVAIK